MPMLRTIERPTKATLRPYSWAASRICWMRCTWLAKLATMMRLLGVGEDLCAGRWRCPARAGRSRGPRRSWSPRGGGRCPPRSSRANACRSVRRPSSGSWSILKSPVCDHHARRGADGDREGVRDGVVDRDELAVEGADALAVALGDLEGVRADAVLLELGLDEREGQLGADQRDVRLLAQQVGDAADVVLVAVREDDALDVVEAVPDRA